MNNYLNALCQNENSYRESKSRDSKRKQSLDKRKSLGSRETGDSQNFVSKRHKDDVVSVYFGKKRKLASRDGHGRG